LCPKKWWRYILIDAKHLAKISALPVLLHGDLHQDNILSHGDDWLVIDPKGVIGFPGKNH